MRELHVTRVFVWRVGGNYSIIVRDGVQEVHCVLEKDASASPADHVQECLQLHLVARTLILNPGVTLPLCFSAQSGGRVLPDPGLFLSVATCQSCCMTCQSPLCYQFSCLASSRFSMAILLLRKLFYKAISEFLSCKLCITGPKKTTINVHYTRTRC